MDKRLPEKGASTHSLGLADRIRSDLAHHLRTCKKTLMDLLASWITSLMTWLVIGIALALPSILYLLLTNATSVGDGFDGSARLNLYLADGSNQAELMSSIREMSAVQKATWIDADAALQEFEQETGFSNILLTLPTNPLPDVIEVEPVEMAPAELRLLTTRLEVLPKVDRVMVDLEWIERLFALLILGQRFVITLSIFLGLGVVLSIGNTIRLAIENRRSEIEIVKLVGGTNAFVRRPFLYLGFWYGFGGALVGWLMVQASLFVLESPIQQLLTSYQHQFVLQGMGAEATLLLFLVGVGLGVVGASVAVSRHLHTIEPS